MKTYNAYREFMFDNKSLISDSSPYDYLRDGEPELYNLLRISKDFTSPIFKELMSQNQTLFEIFNRNPCSFESIEYFNLTNECNKNFSYLYRFTLEDSMLYFIEQLRKKKNIVKHMIDNYNIIGNLSEYNISDMINLYEMNKNNNQTIFRLDLFNEKRIHVDINFVYFNIILQNTY